MSKRKPKKPRNVLWVMYEYRTTMSPTGRELPNWTPARFIGRWRTRAQAMLAARLAKEEGARVVVRRASREQRDSYETSTID